MTETSGHVPWLRLMRDNLPLPASPLTHPSVPLDRHYRSHQGSDSGLASFPKSKYNYRIMDRQKIPLETAGHYGLDQDEAHLALCYAAASKEATQRALTAPPEEAARLKGMKRLASLTLDLYQRLKVAALLPRVLTDERQAELAGQLGGTSYELRKLEKNLFGGPRTPKDDLVTKTHARRLAWEAKRENPMPQAPTSPRPVSRESPHLAA